MPIPKSLDELKTPEEALKFFDVASERLSGEEIQRVKNGQVSEADRGTNPKLVAAWEAWVYYQGFTGAIIADGYTTAYARA